MSFTVILILLRTLSVREGKSGRGWSLFLRGELEAKFEAKRLASSTEEEIDSGPFITLASERSNLKKKRFLLADRSTLGPIRALGD